MLIGFVFQERGSGGRRLISCEECVRSEESNLARYITSSSENVTAGVRNVDVIESVKCKVEF